MVKPEVAHGNEKGIQPLGVLRLHAAVPGSRRVEICRAETALPEGAARHGHAGIRLLDW
jgi:hypothetical protein